ncbi:hypothetical protein [Nisaea sp.]|uniref:hypothetical protein n=1 Tax=Nisaea sp. TaxID=2024842 RepID=UPI0032969D02
MDDAALKRQYDAVVERAGLQIPKDREETMFDTYKNVVSWADIVRHRPRPATLEPSNGYFLETVTRAITASGEKTDV